MASTATQVLESDRPGLGGALASLGLEGEFLRNGALTQLPVTERVRAVNAIIDECLNTGRWEQVVKMMFGEKSVASALYDGDRATLGARILQSAATSGARLTSGSAALELLASAGENVLAGQLLANAPSLSYKEFTHFAEKINWGRLQGGDDKSVQTVALSNRAADIALKEYEYSSAYAHYAFTGNKEGVEQVFVGVLDGAYAETALLERIVKSDPEQQARRVGVVVDRAVAGSRVTPLQAFKLAKATQTALPPDVTSKLNDSLAEKTSGYDVEKEFADRPDIALLWARRHAKDEPRRAYDIFANQGFTGHEVVTAVVTGLGLDRHSHESTALSPAQVSNPHLLNAYADPRASLDVRVSIAMHLRDSSKLQALSGEANELKDAGKAYRLWRVGGGAEGEFIDRLRASLVKEGLVKHLIFWIDNADTKGMGMVYDALMLPENRTNFWCLRKAYETAGTLNDAGKLQATREAMVDMSPARALRTFAEASPGRDEAGIRYVVDVVASRTGTDMAQLSLLVGKYLPPKKNERS